MLNGSHITIFDNLHNISNKYIQSYDCRIKLAILKILPINEIVILIHALGRKCLHDSAMRDHEHFLPAVSLQFIF